MYILLIPTPPVRNDGHCSTDDYFISAMRVRVFWPGTEPCNFEAEAQKSTNAELGAQALQRHLAALELKKNVTNFVKE
ncbi:hypothetical protein M513_06301 [Trichuris suis]|uniref:Uncharacterized protein n=1 Tax=Trichuris suis TaxID=68888 RepID=A0A085M6G4_9BILA|nr:hypothetical protein M513_06301 [Trichuris suis]